MVVEKLGILPVAGVGEINAAMPQLDGIKTLVALHSKNNKIKAGRGADTSTEARVLALVSKRVGGLAAVRLRADLGASQAPLGQLFLPQAG